MSTSLIYHAFGVVGYRYLKEEHKKGKMYLHIEKHPDKRRCSLCGSSDVIQKGVFLREIRTLPIGKRSVLLVLHLHRLYCKSCKELRLEPILLAAPKKHWTKALGRFIVDMLHHSTVEDVAQHLGMSWDTIKDIHKQALLRKYSKRKLRHLKYLGVDEIAIRKGHSYLTVVVDLETGSVVWAAPDRKTESLEIFFKQLKRSRAKIKAIAMDMWPAYIKATMNEFSLKVIVFDRYHVISQCNKMLDDVRRGAAHDASLTERNVYVGIRYLLLQGEEKILSDQEAKAKLERAFTINQPLYIAYILKEELRALWLCTNRKQAKIYLKNWLRKAWASGVASVIKFASTIALHRYGIINYFNYRFTTGKVEGINNKIKLLKRQAYGFRDMEYFILRIYNLHESRYSLIG
jgi:transposase